MRRAAAGAVALVGLLLGLAAPAAAAEDAGPRWSVRPRDPSAAVLAHTVRPGSHVSDAVVVTNEGAAPLELTVTAWDTVPGDDGAPQVADSRTGVGGWVDVPDETVVVAPGAQVVVPVEVAVPADAVVAEHVAAVVTTAAGREGGIAVERRLGLRVVLTVEPVRAGPAGPAALAVGASVAGAALATVLAAWGAARARRTRAAQQVDTLSSAVR